MKTISLDELEIAESNLPYYNSFAQLTLISPTVLLFRGLKEIGKKFAQQVCQTVLKFKI